MDDARRKRTQTPSADRTMIALVKLDGERHCLHRLEVDGGLYVCRRQAGHRGHHDFLPMDMVIVSQREAGARAPVLSTGQSGG